VGPIPTCAYSLGVSDSDAQVVFECLILLYCAVDDRDKVQDTFYCKPNDFSCSRRIMNPKNEKYNWFWKYAQEAVPKYPNKNYLKASSKRLVGLRLYECYGWPILGENFLWVLVDPIYDRTSPLLFLILPLISRSPNKRRLDLALAQQRSHDHGCVP
jgi:hypothetical protein